IRSCTADTLADRIILFLGMPSSCARAADSKADCTIASRVTARASRGLGKAIFSSISLVSSSWSSEPQLAPMRAGFLFFVGDLEEVGELGVALVLEADIAGIDAVFVQSLGAGRIVGEQLVADVMEIADQRRGDAALAQAAANMR